MTQEMISARDKFIARFGEDEYRLACAKAREDYLAQVMEKGEWITIGLDAVDSLEGSDIFGKLGVAGDTAVCVARFKIGEKQALDALHRKVYLVRLFVEEGDKLQDVICIQSGRVCHELVEEFKAKGLPSRMRADLEARLVVMWLQLRGRLFWNKNDKSDAASMFFEHVSGRLMLIHSADFKNWLVAHLGRTLKRDDQVLALIDAAAMNPEVATGVVPGNLWDRKGDVLYISNGDSEMVRVAAGKVTKERNGTDGVVFMAGSTFAPWELMPREQAKDPFETMKIFTNANYQSPHGKMLVRLWTLSLAACIRAYPTIVFTGLMRSGKSRIAKGLCEFLGIETRLSSITDKGEEDFWVSLNTGGIVCFDNVDSRVKWFPDAMQLACTDGSKERRKLYAEGRTTFRANAKTIITTNNPLFANDSGLTDRVTLVRLNRFDGSKKTSDSKLTNDILANRDAGMSWLAYVASSALADKDDVVEGVNMRHPDFAEFALRAARALGMYSQGIAALKSAEMDKAIFTLQNDRVANYIFQILGEKCRLGMWQGSSTDMLQEIRSTFNVDQYDKGVTPTIVGKVLHKYLDQLLVCFEGDRPKAGHVTMYTFKGYAQNFAGVVQSEDESGDGDENYDELKIETSKKYESDEENENEWY